MFELVKTLDPLSLRLRTFDGVQWGSNRIDRDRTTTNDDEDDDDDERKGKTTDGRIEGPMSSRVEHLQASSYILGWEWLRLDQWLDVCTRGV